MRKAVSLPMLVSCLLFIPLAAVMYHSTASYLFSKWSVDDFTYSYFIPLVVGYLIWEKREALAQEPACPTWKGVLPALLGIILYWMGELGGEFTIMFISLWLLCVGVLWSLLGLRKLRVIAFPVFFALVMIPPPNAIYNSLTLRLKLMSSQIGVQMLQMWGLSAYREGNVIDVGFTKLQVVDACSGLRYFFPLIVLGILLAYFFKGSLWKKILIVISTVPISIVTNSMRIASVGILYQFMGPAAAEGFFHDFSGWFIFMISLGILLLEMAVLKRIIPSQVSRLQDPADNVTPHSPCTEQKRYSGLFRFVSPQILIILLLMGATAVSAQGVSSTRHPTPLKKPFSQFPDAVAGWSGKRQVMEKIYLDELGLSDYVIMDYRNAAGNEINLYTAYNESQIKGKSSHSPASCLPGNGWEFKDSGNVSVTLKNGSSILVKRAMIEKNAQRQLTYYWFQQRGRVLRDMYELKLYTFWDALFTKRSDGGLVRIMTPIAASESVQDADGRITAFVREISPVLGEFIPGKDI